MTLHDIYTSLIQTNDLKERKRRQYTLGTNGDQPFILQELKSNVHVFQLLVVELEDLSVFREPLSRNLFEEVD
jgi:hypothetical protein